MHRTIKRLDATHQKLLATVMPLAPEVFGARPSEKEWSVAQIVNHLYLVEESVFKALEKEIANPPQRLGLLRRLVPIAIVGSRMIKVKAPRGMNPVDPPAKEQGLANYDLVRSKLKTLWDSCGQQRLQQTVFKHPFLGAINGVAAVSFLGYHELRHLKQIHEVLRKLEKR